MPHAGSGKKSMGHRLEPAMFSAMVETLREWLALVCEALGCENSSRV
jgi:hypothetical protein